MPIGSTNISMNAIAQEKQATQLPAAAENISLKGLSVDGVNDFQFVGGAFTDITGTPDGNAPYGMGEFNGYSQAIVWGTPNNTVGGGTPFNQNFASQFTGAAISDSAGKMDIATTCDIQLESGYSGGSRVSFYLSRTGDGLTLVSTSQGQVSYSGTINKIEVRFVYYKVNITAAENGGSAIVAEAYSNSATSTTQLRSAQINSAQGVTNSNTLVILAEDGTGQTGFTNREGTDVTWNGDWIDFGANNNVTKSAMIYCSADGDNNEPGATARIQSGGDGTISLQLRANQNNNSIVTLWTKAAGSWSMLADSEDTDTS